VDFDRCGDLRIKGNRHRQHKKRSKIMANKRFNKQVPGFGFYKGKPDKGTEAAMGKTSPQFKKAVAFSKSRKVKNAAN